MIKFIIWISVALIICSLLLEINKEYILETISYPLVQARFILGFVLGFSLFYIVSEGQKSREKRSDHKFKLFITIFLIIAVCQTLNTFFLKGYFNYIPKINIQFFISSGFGLIGGIVFQRGWVWISQKFTSKSSVKSVLERESKSDIRDLDEFSTQIKQDYDPKKYFRENEFFLALK